VALLGPGGAPPPAPAGAEAATLPAGFEETVVFSGLTNPTVVRFASDGRVFVAEKSGLVKVFDSVTDTTPTTFADLRTNVHNFWDRGLLGMTLHPAFPAVPYVYVLYAYDHVLGDAAAAPRWGSPGATSDGCPSPPGPTTDGCVVSGRLSRLEASGNVMTGAEQVLVEDWCQQYPSHSVGTVEFGPDGALYASGGDGASFTFTDYGQDGSPLNPCGDPPGGVGAALTPPTAEGGALRSQDLRTSGDPTTLDGSIIRVDPSTGAGLPTNPLAGSSDPNARRIVAHGFRNPFRFTFRPGTGELWIGDVGWNEWEEINRLTSPADAPVDNFGWPCYEGTPRQGGYDAANLAICENLYASSVDTKPYFAYRHADRVVPNESCPTGSSSIAGLSFEFAPTTSSFPAEYQGALFFADYSRDCIWAMRKDGNPVPSPGSIQTFAAGAANPVNLEFGPDGNLYYPDFDGGTIRRIAPSDSEAPTAPPGLAASAVSGSEIDVSWGAATDDVGVTAYLLERCQGAGCSSFSQIASLAGTTYGDSGLSPSTSYSYRVRARDQAGNLGPYSQVASATTTGGSGPPAGLVAAYAFDEGTGTGVADASGSGNAGSIGTAAWTTAGKYGGALSFNGTSARVTVPDAPSLDLTGAMTLEAWVRPTSVGSWRDVVYKGNDSYYLMGSSSLQSRPAAGGIFSGSYGETFGPSALPLDVWTHLAATYDGQTLRLYVNGDQVASKPQVGSLAPSTHPLQIGGDAIYGQHFAGLIDEVRVYNRALTAAQIVADRDDPIGGGSPPGDTQPPTVSARTPLDGATGVGVAVSPTATFSEAMDPATLTTGTFTLVEQGTTTPLAASVSYENLVATLDPGSSLQAGTTYTARVQGGPSGAKDLAGNALASDVSWSFTTAAAANQPPVPVIDAPLSDLTWKVGDPVSFSGHASDPEQGALPASALSWTLLVQHCPSNCHNHTIQSWNGVASGSFAAPDHEYPSHLELQLRATDAGGLSATTSVELDPQTVQLTFASSPSGLQVTVNAATSATPFTRTVIVGSANSLTAISPQTLSGTSYAFASWSDGGAQSHNVVAPATATTYTATYSASAAPPVNTSLPSTGGGPVRVGRSLTATDGSWNGSLPMTFGYQWLRCSTPSVGSCAPIASGGTATTYVVQAADVGFRLRVAVTATNAAGSATATSNSTSPVKR